ERPLHRLERDERRLLEDRLRDRARVLRIDVDVAVGQRAVDDPASAETNPSLGAGLAGIVDDLGDDLGQDVALGERLRAHADARRLGRRRRGGPQEPEHGAADEEADRGSAPHSRRSRDISGGGAWALKNSETNGSAAPRARTAKVALWRTSPR